MLGPHHIPAGTRIWINVRSLHLDDKHFSNAQVNLLACQLALWIFLNPQLQRISALSLGMPASLMQALLVHLQRRRATFAPASHKRFVTYSILSICPKGSCV